MKTLTLALVAALAFSACAIQRERIVFRHPSTHDEQVCLKPPAMALGPADIPERNRYADCKNKLEEQGYVRAE